MRPRLGFEQRLELRLDALLHPLQLAIRCFNLTHFARFLRDFKSDVALVQMLVRPENLVQRHLEDLSVLFGSSLLQDGKSVIYELGDFFEWGHGANSDKKRRTPGLLNSLFIAILIADKCKPFPHHDIVINTIRGPKRERIPEHCPELGEAPNGSKRAGALRFVVSYFNLDLSGEAMPLFHVFFVLLFEVPDGALAALVTGDDRTSLDQDDEPGQFAGSLAAHGFGDVLFPDNHHVHSLLLKDGADLNGPVNHFFGDAALLHARIGVMRDGACRLRSGRGVGVVRHGFSFSRSRFRARRGCEWIWGSMRGAHFHPNGANRVRATTASWHATGHRSRLYRYLSRFDSACAWHRGASVRIGGVGVPQ